MKSLLCWLMLVVPPLVAAPHNPLLPRPQEIHYGNGELVINGLSIRFGSAPSLEDRFTAQQLSTRLSAAGQTLVAIEDAASAGPAIVLTRTGSVAALPLADEPAGPEAREAYTLKISPEGAEIRAVSSAGLFYGAQTLLQMVEGAGGQAALPSAEVRDWPTLAYRGFMMDLGHGQLLRVAEIERQIDLLARFKGNQYYFYSEAAIALDGYEAVNPHGRYTREECAAVKH